MAHLNRKRRTIVVLTHCADMFICVMRSSGPLWPSIRQGGISNAGRLVVRIVATPQPCRACRCRRKWAEMRSVFFACVRSCHRRHRDAGTDGDNVECCVWKCVLCWHVGVLVIYHALLERFARYTLDWNENENHCSIHEGSELSRSNQKSFHKNLHFTTILNAYSTLYLSFIILYHYRKKTIPIKKKNY